MNAPALPSEAPSYLRISAALAMELASELSAPAEVFQRHGIGQDEIPVILNDPTFRRMVKEAQAEWKSEQNVPERIRLKAQMALEELLLPTFAMAKDPKMPPPSRTDAVKLFERLSGVAKSNGDSGEQGAKFALTINLGNGSGQLKELSGAVIENEV